MANVTKAFPLPDTPLTPGEAERFARKMYRYLSGQTFEGTIRIVSGNRHTIIDGTLRHTPPNLVVMRINNTSGWRALTRDLAERLYFFCHDRASVNDVEWAEGVLTREIWKRRYLDGRLKDKPKPNRSKKNKQRERLASVLKLIAKWETKRKRANNALKKLHVKRKYYEKQLAQ